MRMNRRIFLKRLCASTTALAFSCRPSPERASRKPNIILIMADDLGYGDVGFNGSTKIKTPHLDALAKNGLLFTDYHSNGAVCSPTRAALLTGRYQQRSGLEGVIYVRGETRQTGMEQTEFTFAEALKNAGYKTGIFGKWHLGYKKEYNPVYQGFDVFHGYVSGNIDYISHVDNAGIPDWWHNEEQVTEQGYVTDLITDHAIEFITQNSEKPFCVYLAHETPHWPYQGRFDKADRFPDTEFPSQGSRKDRKNAYKEMIEAMDENVGRILATIKELELEEHTLIFFCSDNGAVPDVGDNGILNSFKGTLWEGGHRVPAFAYWPGRIKPGITGETVMSMDLYPTMLTLSGASKPDNLLFDGLDLSPLLFKKESLPGRFLFWAYRGQKAVRKGNWKLLIDRDEKYLFNLQDDISETKNVLTDFPDKVKEMETALENWETDVYDNVILKTR